MSNTQTHIALLMDQLRAAENCHDKVTALALAIRIHQLIHTPKTQTHRRQKFEGTETILR
jgi:hypothetical protein